MNKLLLFIFVILLSVSFYFIGKRRDNNDNTFTVMNALMKKCPFDPSADGMINKGNGASYHDYLFRSCTKANTCNLPAEQADEVSNVLINTNMPCGVWCLGIDKDNIKYEYTTQDGWSPVLPTSYCLKK